MKDYTVTIAPNDGEGATTVVKLQLDGSTPLIKELTLSAGNNAGLSIDQLPAIDLGANTIRLEVVMPRNRRSRLRSRCRRSRCDSS